MTRRIWPLLLAAAVLTGAMPVQVDDVPATIARLESEWNTAHERGDAAVLERLLADDVVVIVPGMRVFNKADSLGVFAAGKMRFDRYATSETNTRVYGTTAIVTGRLQRARRVGDATVQDEWRFTKVYLQRATGWQVVSFHASNVAP